MTTRSQLLMLVGLVALANTPVRAQDASALGQRGYIGVNGLYQTTETIFSDTVDLDVYQEAGTVTVTHPSGTGPAFDVTAGGPIGRHVGLSYGFGYYRRADPGAVQGLVPHPFFFDRHRAVPGTSDLEREERTFHLSVLGRLPMTRRFQAIVFGGPSYFWVRQDTVTDIALRATRMTRRRLPARRSRDRRRGGGATTSASTSRTTFPVTRVLARWSATPRRCSTCHPRAARSRSTPAVCRPAAACASVSRSDGATPRTPAAAPRGPRTPHSAPAR